MTGTHEGEPTEGDLGKMVHREALAKCDRITHAAELMAATLSLERLAQREASSVMLETFLPLPYKFQVDIPEGAEGFVVLDGDVVEERPTSFVASQVRAIGQHGIEFYDATTGHELHLKGFEFEVYPVFEEPANSGE